MSFWFPHAPHDAVKCKHGNLVCPRLSLQCKDCAYEAEIGRLSAELTKAQAQTAIARKLLLGAVDKLRKLSL
jgi:hypothetical protein